MSKSQSQAQSQAQSHAQPAFAAPHGLSPAALSETFLKRQKQWLEQFEATQALHLNLVKAHAQAVSEYVSALGKADPKDFLQVATDAGARLARESHDQAVHFATEVSELAQKAVARAHHELHSAA
jgi:hypothetical protein